MKLAVLDDGNVRAHGPLDDLRRAWKQASVEERHRFLAEISQNAHDQEGPVNPSKDGFR